MSDEYARLHFATDFRRTLFKEQIDKSKIDLRDSLRNSFLNNVTIDKCNLVMFCLKVRTSSEETAERRGREEKDELQRNGDIN